MSKLQIVQPRRNFSHRNFWRFEAAGHTSYVLFARTAANVENASHFCKHICMDRYYLEWHGAWEDIGGGCPPGGSTGSTHRSKGWWPGLQEDRFSGCVAFGGARRRSILWQVFLSWFLFTSSVDFLVASLTFSSVLFGALQFSAYSAN